MIEDKLAQVGLSPPAASKPAFAYVPVTLHDGVAYVSGQLPKIDGEVRVFARSGARSRSTRRARRRASALCRGWPASRKRLATCRVCAGC
jgi:enamine deaminase RidA (YjgF/YER057c/UK114 family)